MQAHEPISALIYDCEIIKAIPAWYEELEPGVEYCDGWEDFDNMGISVIGVYDLLTNKTRVFCKDNFDHFQTLVSLRKLIIGFNSSSFDDALCASSGLKITTDYDLLTEVRIASGQPPNYVKGRTRAGYSLEALARTNLGYGKSGNGAVAPRLWQAGNIGEVIDYCLLDVQITYELFQKRFSLKDPTDGSELKLRDPVADMKSA